MDEKSLDIFLSIITRRSTANNSSSMCEPAANQKILPAFITPPLVSSFFQGNYSKRKILFLIFLSTILLGTITFTAFYTFHRGFRRTIQFWRGMAPLVAKYKYVKFKATKIDHCSPEELDERLNVYRETTAPKLVDLILKNSLLPQDQRILMELSNKLFAFLSALPCDYKSDLLPEERQKE